MKEILMYDSVHAFNLNRKNPREDVTNFLDIFRSGIAPWYTCDIDRTKTFRAPYSNYVPDDCIMPEFKDTNITYEECAMKKVESILAMSEDKPINLMYSGGIDSSTVLTSFIKYLGVDQTKKKVKILMSLESKVENPWMWEKFIRPYLTIEHSKNFDFTNIRPGELYINGELNDQLFAATGPVKSGLKLSKKLGKTMDDLEVTDELLYDYFLNLGMDKKPAEFWTKNMSKLMAKCPCPEKNIWIFAWWYGFCCKWINVKNRIYMYNNTKEETYKISNHAVKNIVPFFDSTEFQLWSMNNKEPKNLGNYDSFKWTAKKYVSSIIGDEYLVKVKRSSLDKVLVMRNRTQALDSDFVLHNSIDFETFYTPDNDFSDK